MRRLRWLWQQRSRIEQPYDSFFERLSEDRRYSYFRPKYPANRVVPHFSSDGVDCYYLSMLYSIVRSLRPQWVLEIGTFYFGSARVIDAALRKHRGGRLLTCDIKPMTVPGDLKRTTYLPLYPYKTGEDWQHRLDVDVVYRESMSDMTNVQIWQTNLDLIRAVQPEFDVIFIDGDHSEVAVSGDFALACALVKPVNLIIVDDIKEPHHSAVNAFWNNLESPKFDFADCPKFVGLGITCVSPHQAQVYIERFQAGWLE